MIVMNPNLQLEIKLLERNGRTPSLPAYQTDGAAAMDLAAFLEEPVTLPPGGRALIPTGLCVAVPEGYAMLLLARSGLAVRQGICLANGVGLIDSDYRGEIQVGLLNTSDQPFTLGDGDRIAQMLLTPVPKVQLNLREALSDTARGAGGFGSTHI